MMMSPKTYYELYLKDKSEKEMAVGILNAQKFEANYLGDMSNRYRDWSASNLERCEMIKKRIMDAEKHVNSL